MTCVYEQQGRRNYELFDFISRYKNLKTKLSWYKRKNYVNPVNNQLHVCKNVSNWTHLCNATQQIDDLLVYLSFCQNNLNND